MAWVSFPAMTLARSCTPDMAKMDDRTHDLLSIMRAYRQQKVHLSPYCKTGLGLVEL